LISFEIGSNIKIMLKYLLLPIFVSASLIGAVAAIDYFRPNKEIIVGETAEILPPQKTTEELIKEAKEKSSNIKGLYMTADVASDLGAGATRLRKRLIDIAEKTEINGLVIDVKEVCGPDYNEKNIKALLEELKQKNIWAVARIVVFKDASQTEAHPEWYLKRKSAAVFKDECWKKKHLRAKPDSNQLLVTSNYILWQDKRGGWWLDPASDGARQYILEFSKKMIDLGFQEIQFDYIRFPSDGDVDKAIYPSWDGETAKYSVMKSFFEFLNKNLKAHKPDIILSADLFGYAAIRAGDVGIGQRLDDIGGNFDYISFMVYPSHYYSGLYMPADLGRGLPAINYNFSQARSNPGEVVYRSLIFARDFLDGKISTSTFSYLVPQKQATSTLISTSTIEAVPNPIKRSEARLRPWLEDFFHEEDKSAKRPFGTEKIRLQIDAAEKSENHGWLLWNAANVYTENALNKE